MNTTTVTGALFTEMVRCGADNLQKNRTIVNDLNVFPIPDGDTGDNMYMTIESGTASAGGDTISKASSNVAKGMLLGARGNSGVILSRIFAGISRGLEGVDAADINLFGKALESGTAEAYRAVSVPVEGTILTVYREAVAYANSKIEDGATLEGYFDNFISELRRSLGRTPDLLAVLKEAGVVDSGGAGFVYIAEGMKSALDGGISGAGEKGAVAEQKRVDISKFDENSVFDMGYCTEFLLQLSARKTDISAFDIEALRAYLNGVGNSVVAFRDGSIVKVHVHTFDPGRVLSDCLKYGEFLTLKIENMTVQHNETTVQNRFTQKRVRKAYGIVAVAAGDGIKETFSALGCDVVVDGGQSMNPSTQDFIRAFEDIDADTILVFPNNKNIIMAAKQAASLYDKADVRVIETKSIGEGYAAISILDTTSKDTDAIIAEINEAIAGVVSGMVSQAVRDSEKDGVSVKKGDYIGFADKIYVDEPTAEDAMASLAEALGAGDYDIIILICGKDATDEGAQALHSRLSQKYKMGEVIMINGGQPIYDYMIILE